MYSTALKHFKRYIEQYNDKEFQEELFKEEQEFEKYLTDNPADVSRANIEDKPKDKPNHRSVNNRKVWSSMQVRLWLMQTIYVSLIISISILSLSLMARIM